MPGYHSTFYYQLLPLLLLIYITPSTALIYCFYEDPDRAPKLSDCRHILTQLPSITTLSNDATSDTSINVKIMNPSNPFSPNALFSHHSCSIEFRFGKFPKQGGFSMRLMNTDAIQVWTSMQQDAVSITEQCVTARRIGFARGKVVGMGIYYSVQITNRDRATTIQRQHQWRAMEEPERRTVPAWGLDFWEPIYIW